jgi:hypothetical protein
LRNFAKKREYIIILLPVFALVFLFAASPTLATSGTTINIVGQDAIWNGPNTYIASTYHFGSGPVMVPSGTIVMLTDSTPDFHTLTLAVASDLPGTAEDALECTSNICAVAGAVLSTSNCYSAESPLNTGTSASSPCTLKIPYNVETATTGDQVAIAPGQTLYLRIVGAPGSVIHFLCIFHPWMQGEFVITK